MKRKWTVLFIIILLASVYVVWYYTDGKKDKVRRNLFSKVTPQMTQSKVIEILGKPDTIFYIKDGGSEMTYFTEEYDGIGKSGTSTVVLDSTGTVLFTSFGD